MDGAMKIGPHIPGSKSTKRLKKFYYVEFYRTSTKNDNKVTAEWGHQETCGNPFFLCN